MIKKRKKTLILKKYCRKHFGNLANLLTMIFIKIGVIMLTEVNKVWKPSLCSLLIRSSIQRTSFCWEEITSALPSIGSMVSMMNVFSNENFFLANCRKKSWFFFCWSDKTVLGKRRYNIKLWKTFTDCFNCLPVAAVVDDKIFCMHGGLSPELTNLE